MTTDLWKRASGMCYRKGGLHVAPSIEELEMEGFEGLAKTTILELVQSRAKEVSIIPGLSFTRHTYVGRDDYIIDDLLKRAAWILHEPTEKRYTDSLWYFEEGISPVCLYKQRDTSFQIIGICNDDIAISVSGISSSDWYNERIKISKCNGD